MTLASLGLAFIAGLLSTLSPCVLPLLPIVLGTAVAAHRLGAIALGAGLCTSFVVIGIFIATLGFSIGLDDGWFRRAGALVMTGVGLVLLLPLLHARMAAWSSPVGGIFNMALSGLGASLPSQFALGLLLGAIWSPCVGPTLGAASILAAQGKDLGQVALVMAAFGVGTIIPLMAIGFLSREALLRWRGRFAAGGLAGKLLLGSILVGVGVSVLTGLDKRTESWLVANSPAWLIDVTTRF